jgi:hypothetical protein
MALAERVPLVRGSDIRADGISTRTVSRLVSSGRLERVFSLDDTLLGYKLPGRDLALPNGLLADIATRHPGAVLCLFSALRHHDMTDITDLVDTAAVPKGANRVTTLPNFRLIQWTDQAMFEAGVDSVLIGGIPARVTSPARTVADLYRPGVDRSLGLTDEIRRHAVGQLVLRQGEQGLDELLGHAAAFGSDKRLSEIIGAVREALRWQGQTRPR